MFEQKYLSPARADTPGERWDWTELRAAALRNARAYLDRDTAEDATQDALLRAWRNAPSCGLADPTPWVATIARREALRTASRYQRETIQDTSDDDRGPVDTDCYRRALLENEIRQALRALSPKEQQALLLHYWADMTHQEIATALSIPVGTIKLRVFRGRRKLGVTLRSDPIADD